MDLKLYNALPIWAARRQAGRRRLVNGDEHKGQIFCGHCGRLWDKPNWAAQSASCVLCAPKLAPEAKPFYKLYVYTN